MKLKVCGITLQAQLNQLIELNVDMVGLNFYPKSPRYLDHELTSDQKAIIRVGVFVNEDFENINQITRAHKLDMLQLHGEESVEFCREASEFKPVIKAFGLHNDFDFKGLSEYEPYIEYFLFDTRTAGYGGSGKKFNWSLLSKYQGQKPFFLSGGIALTDIEEIKKLNHSKLVGVDVNSGFEVGPGIKNIDQIKELKNRI